MFCLKKAIISVFSKKSPLSWRALGIVLWCLYQLYLPTASFNWIDKTFLPYHSNLCIPLFLFVAILGNSADFFHHVVGLGESKLKKRTVDIFRDIDGDRGEEVDFVVCLKETTEKCRT